MNILKSRIVWLCFIPVAILNGGLREYVLTKILGEKWALPVSGIILSVCIFLITWLLLPRIIKALTFKDCWLIGICWGVLTIAFEFGVGLAGGNNALELLASVNPLSGQLGLADFVTKLLFSVFIKKHLVRQHDTAFFFCLLYFTIFASVRVTRTSKATRTTTIRTVANSLPANEAILLTFLISNRYIPHTVLQTNFGQSYVFCSFSPFFSLK